MRITGDPASNAPACPRLQPCPRSLRFGRSRGCRQWSGQWLPGQPAGVRQRRRGVTAEMPAAELGQRRSWAFHWSYPARSQDTLTAKAQVFVLQSGEATSACLGQSTRWSTGVLYAPPSAARSAPVARAETTASALGCTKASEAPGLARSSTWPMYPNPLCQCLQLTGSSAMSGRSMPSRTG